MEMKFIYNEPAAILGDALLMSDLHLGIEYDLQQKGYNIPLQFKAAADKVNALLKQSKTKQIIFLGDVKHDVYGMKDPEERMLNAFFARLKTKRITVCKGNHDSSIEGVKGITVAPAEGMLFGQTLLFHGHATPDPDLLEGAAALACGHEHPLAQIKEGKHTWTEKAWILGRQEGRKFVIFPHFGDLVGGRPFNPEKHLVRFLDPKSCQRADVHLLSGLKLGKARNRS